MNDEPRCLNCGRTSDLVPLISLRYIQKEHSICPQCLPILIHKPEQLGAIAGAWTAKGRTDEG
jgi:hypothetical protein